MYVCIYTYIYNVSPGKGGKGGCDIKTLLDGLFRPVRQQY